MRFFIIIVSESMNGFDVRISLFKNISKQSGNNYAFSFNFEIFVEMSNLVHLYRFFNYVVFLIMNILFFFLKSINLFEILKENKFCMIRFQYSPLQAKTSKSGREYFRVGAESYSSLGCVGKKKKNTRVHFWTFSPVDKFRVLACIG